MTKRELEAALADACKVRDQWCAEYTKVRDQLARLTSSGASTSSDRGSRSRRAGS
jgi:hypothetical protein